MEICGGSDRGVAHHGIAWCTIPFHKKKRLPVEIYGFIWNAIDEYGNLWGNGDIMCV